MGEHRNLASQSIIGLSAVVEVGLQGGYLIVETGGVLNGFVSSINEIGLTSRKTRFELVSFNRNSLERIELNRELIELLVLIVQSVNRGVQFLDSPLVLGNGIYLDQQGNIVILCTL